MHSPACGPGCCQPALPACPATMCSLPAHGIVQTLQWHCPDPAQDLLQGHQCAMHPVGRAAFNQPCQRVPPPCPAWLPSTVALSRPCTRFATSEHKDRASVPMTARLDEITNGSGRKKTKVKRGETAGSRGEGAAKGKLLVRPWCFSSG
ncbi:uncharacterized protein LOC144138109 isoform X9 [Haemaphysalis longicornis]